MRRALDILHVERLSMYALVFGIVAAVLNYAHHHAMAWVFLAIAVLCIMIDSQR
jgi:hypothetical protein